MLIQDQKNEEEAIKLYREGIILAQKEGDFVTKRLLVDILSEEEKHLDTFGKLLVGMTSPFTQPEI
jgi:bacterioferritin (cytochrome b1)